MCLKCLNLLYWLQYRIEKKAQEDDEDEDEDDDDFGGSKKEPVDDDPVARECTVYLMSEQGDTSGCSLGIVDIKT